MATVFTDRVSVSANASSTNRIPVSLAYCAKDSVVELGASSSAVGLNATLTATGPNGLITIVRDQEVNAQNRMPLFPDDYIAAAVVPAGSYLQLDWRNTTAGAITAFGVVKISP